MTDIERQAKPCSLCGEVKPTTEFYAAKKAKDGLQSRCKSCQKAANAKWWADHPEARREANRRFKDKDPERARALDRESRARRAESISVRRRQRRLDDPEFRERDKAQKREAYWATLEAERERQRAYRARPEYRKENRERSRRWREANRGRVQDQQRLRWYGITREQYEAMLTAQGGGCAICGGPPRGKGSRGDAFSVDHDHTTGAIRGLLCGPCNLAIGQLEDDAARIRRAAEYLEADRPDAHVIPAETLARITWNRP